MPGAIICSMPAEGHVRPLLVVAAELLRRGHRVRVLTGRRYEPLVTAAGAEFRPLPDEADTLDAIGAADDRRRGLDAMNTGVRLAFFDPALPAGLALLDLLDEEPAEVVVHDPLFLGVQALHRLSPARRPLTVMAGILPLGLTSVDTPPFGLGLVPLRHRTPNRVRNRVLTAVAARVVLRPAHRAADAMLRDLGAPPLAGRFFTDILRSSDLLGQLTVPEFEYPRSDAPDALRFYGPLTRLAPSGVDAPPWLEALGTDRPVVHVTQGTVANTDFTELVVPTLAALADDDVDVVVTTGGRPLDALPPLPANAHAGAFLPYDHLLPRTAVLVTNGGYGGLHHAMEHGVPIVIAGDSEDKVETSARVRWSGVGVSLGTSRPTPDAVAGAVRRVLDDPSYARASARIGAAIATSPGVVGLVDDVERALADR